MKLPVLNGPIAPVFVVGMNGSDTSMLAESLGRHPELYAFPGETRMIPHYIDVATRFGNLDDDSNFHRFWTYVVSSSPDLEIFNSHQTPELPANWREFPRSLSTILDAVMRQFAAESGTARWCEKSPNNSEHILRIAGIFPDAAFIHIIRDGRDCAASTNRRQHRHPELTIYRWRKLVSEARRQGRQISDRYMEVKYEDLTNDPKRWMRAICEFIHLDFDPKVLQSGMPQSEKRAATRTGAVGRIEPNSEKFLKYFSQDQLRRLEWISGSLLERLGYPVYFEPSSNDLGKLRSKVIRLVDFFKANGRLRRKLSGDKDVTWRYVFQGMLSSAREYSSKKI